jgi:hypothetical protein
MGINSYLSLELLDGDERTIFKELILSNQCYMESHNTSLREGIVIEGFEINRLVILLFYFLYDYRFYRTIFGYLFNNMV